MSPDAYRKAMDHDHRYDITPRTCKRKLFQLENKYQELEQKYKIQNQQLKRLQKKTSHFEDIINQLNQERMSSENCSSALKSIPSEGLKQLWERVIANSEQSKVSKSMYPPALRSFALTLHFYSPRAYNYVREEMKLALPDLSTIKTWYNSINGEAGFTQESFDALKHKVREASKRNQTLLCSLMLDEIGIKTGTQRSRSGKV